MNNPIKLLISGADMGGLIASCALRHDFHESPRQEDRFHIYRIEKDTLTMEDVDALLPVRQPIGPFLFLDIPTGKEILHQQNYHTCLHNN